eukprot:jgi/Mesvir1/14990/Mv14649-RA.1
MTMFPGGAGAVSASARMASLPSHAALTGCAGQLPVAFQSISARATLRQRHQAPQVTPFSKRGLFSCEMHSKVAKKSLAMGLRPVQRDPSVCASAGNASAGKSAPHQTKVERLRELLAGPSILQGPACHDALSAKLVEQAGFPFAFMSGFGVSACRIGSPDTGLISFAEMVDQGRNMCDVTSIPIIGDGDTGYGNALNVKRTVRAYTAAGFAGIILEDQVMPKRCGHTRGKKVVDREEAVMRIKAAADARAESGRDIVIVARTDSRQTTGLEEALWRVKAFKEAGADVLFIDALESRAEMEALCKAAGGTPTMANMLEGGGKTPIFSPMELQDIGYKLIAYPLSLMMVSVSAMESALTALKSGRMPPSLPTFAHVRKVIGFDDYYVDEARYATSPPVDPEGPRVAPSGTAAATPVEPKTVMPAQPQTKPNAAKEEVVESQLKAAGVEADFILSPRDDEGQPQGRYRSSNASDRDTSGSSRSWSSSNSTSRSSNVVVDTELVGPVGPGPESGGGGRKREKTREEMRDGMSNRSLRLRVTSSTGVHKLDLTVPVCDDTH